MQEDPVSEKSSVQRTGKMPYCQDASAPQICPRWEFDWHPGFFKEPVQRTRSGTLAGGAGREARQSSDKRRRCQTGRGLAPAQWKAAEGPETAQIRQMTERAVGYPAEREQSFLHYGYQSGKGKRSWRLPCTVHKPTAFHLRDTASPATGGNILRYLYDLEFLVAVVFHKH